ncbi:ABC transporter ATP-binding protein [Bacillus sp. BGMRC 2118]|nr:ABC transporter ATP-binding protein [Bacillus sp. BGMRC 2118]
MIISVRNIHKSFGKINILKGVSFYIEVPQIVGLVGPNGSGKSTLLNIITNLLDSDKGEVTILNRSSKDPNIFKEVAFMQDNSVLYEYLTGYDHLQFIGDIHGIDQSAISSVAKRVGMESYLNKKVDKYSLGMKQHLLLAMALLIQPKLLIMDEPLNGLDPTSAIRVRKILVEEYKKGTTILLSSHNLSELDKVASKIIFLNRGEIIEEDFSQYEKIYYDLYVSDPVLVNKILKEEILCVNVEVFDNKIRLYNNSKSPIKNVLNILLLNDIELLDIEKKVFGTEDRYRKIFVKSGE